jgi:hypothetical protein
MLGVRISPWGLLRSDGADPDPWVSRALADEHGFPFGHGVLSVIIGDAYLLDQLSQKLEEWTSREQR